MLRRPFLASLASLVVLTTTLVVGCGTAVIPQSAKPDAALVQTLAPTGTLRIGVYKGSPSSLVTAADGTTAGVAHDVGQSMAKQLGVPAQVVVFDRIALVLEALKAGQIDMTFTNASPARQREFAFSQPMLSVELGYLVPANGKLQNIDHADAGMRIGVSQGSSSQASLGEAFKASKLTAFASLDLAKTALRNNDIDAFATNKGILNELLDDLNKSDESGTQKLSYKILDGRWGYEHMGIAIPLERALKSSAAVAFVGGLGRKLKASGELTKMAERAGLRGTVNVDIGGMK